MAETTKNLGLNLTTGSDLVDPVSAFSNNFKKIDELGADYVIEQGKSGEWWYRKWNSGRCECGIDSKTFDSKTSNNWAGHGYLCGKWAFPAYPFTFSQPPFVTIMYRYEPNGYGGIVHVHPASSESNLLTQPPSFSVYDANGPHQYTNPKFGMMATGWYK
jgi:hypothetical protein